MRRGGGIRVLEGEIKFPYVLDYNDPRCCFLSTTMREREGEIGGKRSRIRLS